MVLVSEDFFLFLLWLFVGDVFGGLCDDFYFFLFNFYNKIKINIPKY